MIRICQILSGDLWAGAEVMAFHLLKGLNDYEELDIFAVLLNEGRLARALRKLGIQVYVIDESKNSFLNIVFSSRRILRDHQPNVIHAHRYKENILAYLVSKSIKGSRLVSTQHGMPEMYGGVTGLRHKFISKFNFCILARCFQKVVVVSGDIQKEFVGKFGFKEERVRVIHNGVEIPNGLPGEKRGARFVVGSCGRLFPVKNYPLMVEIAKAVLQRMQGVRFELAGDGPERKKIQALVSGYGLNGTFVLKGHLDDLSKFYRGLDIYLNTSIHEGIPMSVLEAMANGLPVVAPKVGGLLEIVDDGAEGFLIEKSDPHLFAEKCLLLCKDQELRKKMASAAREKAIQAFSLERMAREYCHLYVHLGEHN